MQKKKKNYVRIGLKTHLYSICEHVLLYCSQQHINFETFFINVLAVAEGVENKIHSNIFCLYLYA